MTNKILALKYRPQNLKFDWPRNYGTDNYQCNQVKQNTKRVLTNWNKRCRKTTTARLIAKALNCQKR